ncbi:hypothetical protein FS749_007787 [Ceratobasidium sp. UAMH 11750]|nr:hypothetical protein FS749_007787 [Ceratobasidium sp. UAMH 11750]
MPLRLLSRLIMDTIMGTTNSINRRPNLKWYTSSDHPSAGTTAAGLLAAHAVLDVPQHSAAARA